MVDGPRYCAINVFVPRKLIVSIEPFGAVRWLVRVQWLAIRTGIGRLS